MEIAKRKVYPDDLTDGQWYIISPAIKDTNTNRGRPSKYGKREMLNAIFYLLRTGCSWRHLPHDFPPWKSVYTQFRTWRLRGFFERLNKSLRGKVRILSNRNEEPSTAIVDSQSIKTTERGGTKGYDGAKKIRGRKRHLLVDTQGFVVKAAVTAANCNDRDGLELILERLGGMEDKIKKNMDRHGLPRLQN